MSDCQYNRLVKRLQNEGVWVRNQRTGKKCLTVINVDFEYNVGIEGMPILTTKRVAWKTAIAEMLGYLRGYSNAAQFRELGCHTWDANADDNKEWLRNKHRKGAGDMGRAYGVQGRRWIKPGVRYSTVDQLQKVVDDLAAGRDDRREIVTYWNPGELEKMCLPPCMHTYVFSLLEDTLYLTTYQRSADVPLGLPFNMVQVGWLLTVIAWITNKRVGKAYHKIVNAHVYDDQWELLQAQIQRPMFQAPRMLYNPTVKTLNDLETWVTPDEFSLVKYNHSGDIVFPFTV